MKNGLIKIGIIIISIAFITKFTFWMGFNFLLKSLIIVMAIDYLLSISLGILGNSRFGSGVSSSKIGFKGILKKLTILLLVGISFLITMYLSEYNINFKYTTDIVITAFFVNELVSILENAKLLEISIPSFQGGFLYEYKEIIFRLDISKCKSV